VDGYPGSIRARPKTNRFSYGADGGKESRDIFEFHTKGRAENFLRHTGTSATEDSPRPPDYFAEVGAHLQYAYRREQSSEKNSVGNKRLVGVQSQIATIIEREGGAAPRWTCGGNFLQRTQGQKTGQYRRRRKSVVGRVIVTVSNKSESRTNQLENKKNTKKSVGYTEVQKKINDCPLRKREQMNGSQRRPRELRGDSRQEPGLAKQDGCWAGRCFLREPTSTIS